MATDFASSYPSLFGMTKRYSFCSDQAQINGVSGVMGGGCAAPYPYYYGEDRAGFKVRNDPTDTRISRGIYHPGADLCTSLPKTLTFSDNVKSADIFRIYVPIGTGAVRVSLQVPSQVNIAAVAQFGQPPSYSPSDYSSISGKSPSLKDFSTSARAVGNWDGIIYLINDSNISGDSSFISNLPVQDRFLYVKVIDYGGGYVQSVNYSITVDYAQYLAWYKTMQTQDWKTLGEEGSGPVIIRPDTPTQQPGIELGPSVPVPPPVPPSPSDTKPEHPGEPPKNDLGIPLNIGGMTDLLNVLTGGKTQSPTPGTSVFNQPMPAQKASELAAGPIRIPWTQLTMELKPVLKTGFTPVNPFFPGGGGQPSDFPLGQQVKVYAVYIDANGQIYAADSNSVFQHYVGGDIPCFTATIRSDAVMWPADSDGINPFSSLKGAVIPGRSYIFGVTPANVGSSAEDFMKHFRGTCFQLVN